MNNKFPDDFLWGAATSAYQVEGNNIYSDWWEWEQAGHTEPSKDACDHYARYKGDFQLAKELGHNAHRLGVEWSRLEKEEGKWDNSEWDHYKDVIAELTRLSIEPVLTLHHFTIPLWLARQDGWANEKTPVLFSRFAAKAAKELGKNVRYWITINEPNILAFLAYFMGIWPPGKKDFHEALLVLRNLLRGHVLSYKAIKENFNGNHTGGDVKVGTAMAVTAFHPCSYFSIPDRLSVFARERLHNHSFINSAIMGKTLIPGLPKEKLPCKNTVDFIGLNYYFRQFVRHDRSFVKKPLGDICSLEHHPEAGPATDMGWEIYPEGLYEVARSFRRYNLPLVVTENGLATKDDTVRQKYIKDHLVQLLKAINEGIPIKGYLHWSLLDNFEWAEGYSKKFGLVEVDFSTQKRTVRDSARYYSDVIRTGKP